MTIIGAIFLLVVATGVVFVIDPVTWLRNRRR
jgi:hypothetical protein